MATLLLAFLVIAISIVGLGLGVLCGRAPLAGSCGGPSCGACRMAGSAACRRKDESVQ